MALVLKQPIIVFRLREHLFMPHAVCSSQKWHDPSL